MKNTRLMRLLITMIAALMVLGCVLTSCTKTPDNPDTDTKDTGDDTGNPEDTQETEPDMFEDLRGTTFDGAEFVVYTYKTSGGWAHYLEEHDGGVDRLNEAAVERNGMVEELLDVVIEIEYATTSHDKVLSDYVLKAMGGQHFTDLIVPWATEKIASLITSGALYDIKQLDYMNLDAEYYNQSANKNFTLKGRQYAFVSDYTYAVQQRFAFLANLDMIEEYGALENIETDASDYYELVVNGELTVDNVLKMAEGIYSENGSEDPLAGIYGFATNPNSAGRMFQDWGVELVALDDEGELVFNLYNDDIEAKYSKLNELIYDGDTYFDLIGNNTYYKIFNEGRAMFGTYSSDPYSFVNKPWAEIHFAYSPMPKYDAEDDYVTVAHGGLILVSSLIEDPDMVGAVAEALSIASNDLIKEEYIANYFETRVIQDPEGIELYEIIRDTAYIDMNRYIDPNGLVSGVGFIVNPLKEKEALSTYNEQNGQAIIDAYNNLFKRLANIKQ